MRKNTRAVARVSKGKHVPGATFATASCAAVNRALPSFLILFLLFKDCRRGDGKDHLLLCASFLIRGGPQNERNRSR
jgi:hypothetical protein